MRKEVWFKLDNDIEELGSIGMAAEDYIDIMELSVQKHCGDGLLQMWIRHNADLWIGFNYSTELHIYYENEDEMYDNAYSPSPREMCLEELPVINHFECKEPDPFDNSVYGLSHNI